MAAHVVVIDSNFRRKQVKVNPGMYLNDVLQEACEKLSLDPQNYGLRNKNKSLDLSLTYRLSGLTSGAKLELVQASRSPTAVSVALEELADGPSARLTDKFASNTSFWMILRHFESKSNRNFTGRSYPSTSQGAGKLYYEQPVLQIMQRELASFTDLQKGLSQLGFNKGSVLLRLSHRQTDRPVEEAMGAIEEYFKSMDGSNVSVKSKPTATMKSIEASQNGQTSLTQDTQTIPATASLQDHVMQDAIDTKELPSDTSPATEITKSPTTSSRPIEIFSAPTSATPSAFKLQHNDSDYQPSLDALRTHQARLKSSTINKRLQSDAEVAEADADRARRIAAIPHISVKIRYPDQSVVVTRFTPTDSVADLYVFVRSTLNPAFADTASFMLSYAAEKGGQKPLSLASEKEQNTKLIEGLGWRGDTLVNFSWGEGVSEDIKKGTVRPILAKEYAEQAKPIKVELPVASSVVEERDASRAGAGSEEKEKAPKKAGAMPKWLKLPGKK